jgi:cytidyltransferase-like protein
LDFNSFTVNRILITGVYDLFHIGHQNILRRVKQNFKPCTVIAGIHSDKTVAKYKRIPIWNEAKRYQIVRDFKYVDEVVEDFPLGVFKEQIESYNIDYVIRGKERGISDFIFDYPREQGILIEIPRTEGISTTQLREKMK